MTAPAQLICDYASLVNDVGYYLSGLRATSTDVITENVASTNQAADILRCISKGLQYVYSAHRWSFLRPIVSITTRAWYSTGTITVDASGNVTGDGTTFPSYSVTAGGWLTIPAVRSFAIGTYTSGTALVLTGFTGYDAITTATTYVIGFPAYPITSATGGTVDSLEGPLTYPQGYGRRYEALTRVSELDIRKMLVQRNNVGMPLYYAEATAAFDPTTGSTRTITFYPVPDQAYTLTAVGTLRPSMIDSSNKYPLGVEVLAPCIAESCLAAAEREIEGKDSTHADAVHNRALGPLLAMAIQRDKEYSTPDSLGVDNGQIDYRLNRFRSGGDPVMQWDAGGGFTGNL